MIDLLKSIFFPSPYEYDLRPLIIVIIIMASSITYVIRRDWEDIKDEHDNDWELK
jgi:hypothetical protein